jgi:hypothetical protein
MLIKTRSKECFGNLHLGFPGRNDSVTGDQLGHDTTSGLNTEGERANIDEDNVGSAFGTRKDTTLDSSTVSNSFIRVDSFGGFLATEVLFEELLDLGNTGGSTDENNL